MTRALVTGAGKRLGRAMALDLARRGYDVAIHYAASRDAAETVADEVRTIGRTAAILQADLLDEATTPRSSNRTPSPPPPATAGTGTWNRTCARPSC
jgi:NAD(P)-dependent dehydrogenase (short-subunit alcohol dehydrogenase family)